MKTFRTRIALFSLVLYLLSVGGAAWSALSCDCFVHHFLHAGAHRSECLHCTHSDDGREALAAPCCDDRHDTEASLYTAQWDDHGTRQLRPAVSELLPALLLVEATRPAALPAMRHCVRIRHALPDSPERAAAGLRAPPVSV